mmetsp:Transcript_11344/g.22147  ORF Transcript_11344/g.22147 Transcript_11344/m.22147 type:complete len:381 (+) Transcript_11344:287-1429(+)
MGLFGLHHVSPGWCLDSKVLLRSNRRLNDRGGGLVLEALKADSCISRSAHVDLSGLLEVAGEELAHGTEATLIIAALLVGKHLTEVLKAKTLGLGLEHSDNGEADDNVEHNENEASDLKVGSTVHASVSDITKHNVGEEVHGHAEGHTDTTNAEREGLSRHNPAKRSPGSGKNSLEDEDHDEGEDLYRGGLVVSIGLVNVDAGSLDGSSNDKKCNDGEGGSPDGEELTSHRVDQGDSNKGKGDVDSLEDKIVGEGIKIERVEEGGGVRHKPVDTSDVLGEGNTSSTEDGDEVFTLEEFPEVTLTSSLLKRNLLLDLLHLEAHNLVGIRSTSSEVAEGSLGLVVLLDLDKVAGALREDGEGHDDGKDAGDDLERNTKTPAP